jgi:ATP-dependent helicase/nuclease subunit B
MQSSRANLFSIPASAPFLAVLIDALCEGRLVRGFPASADPLALASATLYLPTRRACRRARDIFLDRLGRDAAILPRIVPLGDIDEEEIAFAGAANAQLGETALELPDALTGLDRLMPLTALILQWAQTIAPRERSEAPLIANSAATAFALAKDLARLMDDMATRQVEWRRLDELVPEEFDVYWKLTLDFIKFIRASWPDILAEKNRIDPAERRDRLIAAEIERLKRTAGPVIAAGSTGSIPATATLLDTIAKLPHGAVVLPGLDTDLDDATWATIAQDPEGGHGHPQFAMAHLLERIGVARGEVTIIGASAAHGRERVASEALRPAAASQLWKDRLQGDSFTAAADTAMADVCIIEAANPEEEALAIAVALREAVETPGKTAALVTSDVALGRRVAAALARWDVPVDDSRGLSLADTPEGTFARLAAEVALGGAAPVPVLALLKHPSSRFDDGTVAALERAVLRGPRPQHGTSGLAAALDAIRAEIGKARSLQASALHRSDPRLRLSDHELDSAASLIGDLNAAIAPLERPGRERRSLAQFAAAHAEVIAALGAMTEPLATAFEQIRQAGSLQIGPADYLELFHAAILDMASYKPPTDARVQIFGLLESRLQSVDRLVLGGLVEGVWPPETRSDPWLSRPMRHQLGLDLPERRVGLSAHDFAQALGAREVMLTRAARLAGAPTVPSRFLQRFGAVIGEARWNTAVKQGARYLAFARQLDDVAEPLPAKRPQPKPPLQARPHRLSVTEIEDLLRDPYTIYARHVLDLQPLDDIDAPPDAATRGTVIHDAIAEFAQKHPAQLPADAARVLTEIGREKFRPLAAFPEARAFWWPRFQRIAQWFATFDATRRANAGKLHIEVGGRIELPFGPDRFTLTVRADRIECLADGRYAILDYKTGAPPTDKQVNAGLSPQLTLEAAILRNGGFDGIPRGASICELLYVRLRGGAEPGEARAVKFKDGTPDKHADHALAELTKTLSQFADPSKPYYSLLHPMWKTHYGTYDHLARVQEWSLVGGVKDGNGE